MAIGRSEVELETSAPIEDPPRRGPRLTLAVALPKGERQKWLVEKLTELGADRLVPLVTERGVAEATPGAIERLSRGITHPEQQVGLNFHQANVFVDDALHVPVRVDYSKWPDQPGGAPRLMAEYSYTHLKLNPTLSDDRFDPALLRAQELD